MTDRAELKLRAKSQIKGNIGILFVISLLIGLITGAIAAGFVLAPAFGLSVAYVYLRLAGGTRPDVADMFYGFKDLWCAFKVQFLTGLFTSLWSLLFVIPGIIKALSYSMSMFILAENPGMPALEAIDRSKKMMDGHKADLFVLGLSFIGWFLLGSVTLGIAYIWIAPYVSTTYVNFYNEIKGEKII